MLQNVGYWRVGKKRIRRETILVYCHGGKKTKQTAMVAKKTKQTAMVPKKTKITSMVAKNKLKKTAMVPKKLPWCQKIN